MAVDIFEIWIHCTATSPEWMDARPAEEKVAEINRWHRKRGWNGFGYNELIDRGGAIAKGRPIGQPTAAVRGHNRNAVHLVLVGGRGAEATDKFNDHFTEAQRVILLKRLGELQADYPNAEIRGHNEVAAKGCPGFNVADFLRANPIKQPKPAPKPAGGLLAALISIVRSIFRGKA